MSGKVGYLGTKRLYNGKHTLEAITEAYNKAAKRGWAKILIGGSNGIPCELSELAAKLNYRG